MNKISSKVILYFVVSILLFSCTSRKKIIYFQGDINAVEASKNYSPVFCNDDLLSIVVMGMDAETVKPFNLPTSNTPQASMGGYAQGIPAPSGYLVDTDGNIDFPSIGKIKVAGLSRNVFIDSLKNRLKPYLSNPNIIVRILNFKVTVLGDVHNPGTFTIPNERISLPEALGIAEDLYISANRKNVTVIREDQGKKTKYTVDLTTKDLFSSPVYYLKQNDIVYVEPNQAKINSASINPTNVALMVSLTSLILTLIIKLRNK